MAGLVEKVAPEESGMDTYLDELADLYEEDEILVEECGCCGGEMVEVGSLGMITHMNCRNCGVWTYRYPTGEEEAA
jgi:hypothetical protein